MSDDFQSARRQRDALARERRRGLWRAIAVLFIGGAAVTLLAAGALTWIGRL